MIWLVLALVAWCLISIPVALFLGAVIGSTARHLNEELTHRGR